MGRAKAWENTRPTTPEQKRSYGQEQRDAVRRVLADYHPDALVVFDVDFGHTDPQLIIPYGGEVRVDGPAREIHVRY
jgi:muramoyltetrapeptide carboxypeptidase LdcA involved in peptidoglycan recycling